MNSDAPHDGGSRLPHVSYGSLRSVVESMKFPDARPPSATNKPNPWRSLFRSALYEQATPIFTHDQTTIPAASVWTGSRLWTSAFRAAGLATGDAVAIDLAPGPIFVQVLVACFWEGLTVALLGRENREIPLPEQVRVRITDRSAVTENAPVTEGADQSALCPVWHAVSIGGPTTLCSLPEREEVASSDRLLVIEQSSWLGVSDLALLDALFDEVRVNQSHGQVIISLIDWTSKDALIRGVLAPIATGAAHVITASDDGVMPIDSLTELHQPDRVLSFV